MKTEILLHEGRYYIHVRDINSFTSVFREADIFTDTNYLRDTIVSVDKENLVLSIQPGMPKNEKLGCEC